MPKIVCCMCGKEIPAFGLPACKECIINLPLQGEMMETTNETTTETTTNTPMVGSISLAEALYCTYHELVTGEYTPSWTELKQAADADNTGTEAMTVTTWGKVATRAYDLLSHNN